ncbi:ankyrin repeat domain-containing protein [Pseudoalteromonas ardens]|uniref:ankyrin repeat domain-containing protein n=1 Tax=Pseudoalteromonas ardens TaxID=3048490 RepID=UPI0024C3D862|nr:ankyrin repeat domain-containing protein [Pseudoalteromonas sp. R96]MDK1311000.1 ankyrin repeat domain-containing protein [Pseudoalteromonas sp. R96]
MKFYTALRSKAILNKLKILLVAIILTVLTLNFISDEQRDINLELVNAIKECDIAAAQPLLEEGADPNIYIDGHGSAMAHSPFCLSTEPLELLLAYGGDPNIQLMNLGKRLIFRVISPGKLASLKLLVKSGAEINVTTETGLTPLMQSLMLGQFDMAIYLIDSGSHLTAKDNFGTTALGIYSGGTIKSPPQKGSLEYEVGLKLGHVF